MLLLSIHTKFSSPSILNSSLVFRLSRLQTLERKLDGNPLLKSGCLLGFEEDHEILSVVNSRKGPRNQPSKRSYFREEEIRA